MAEYIDRNKIFSVWRSMPDPASVDSKEQPTVDPDIVALAERIRASDIWIWEDVNELCIAAGLESEWKSSDGDTSEAVIWEAADRLGVEII